MLFNQVVISQVYHQFFLQFVISSTLKLHLFLASSSSHSSGFSLVILVASLSSFLAHPQVFLDLLSSHLHSFLWWSHMLKAWYHLYADHAQMIYFAWTSSLNSRLLYITSCLTSLVGFTIEISNLAFLFFSTLWGEV